MRLVLHPPGLIRLISKQTHKGGETKHPDPETKRPDTIDPDEYEMTPYGRKPLRRGHRRLKLTAKILAGSRLRALWFGC